MDLLHVTLLVSMMGVMGTATCLVGSDVPLPDGVRAVWDLEKAYREKTTTRERVCLNGLWLWQPAKDVSDAVPTDRWGYFKVPGCG